MATDFDGTSVVVGATIIIAALIIGVSGFTIGYEAGYNKSIKECHGLIDKKFKEQFNKYMWEKYGGQTND